MIPKLYNSSSSIFKSVRFVWETKLLHKNTLQFAHDLQVIHRSWTGNAQVMHKSYTGHALVMHACTMHVYNLWKSLRHKEDANTLRFFILTLKSLILFERLNTYTSTYTLHCLWFPGHAHTPHACLTFEKIFAINIQACPVGVAKRSKGCERWWRLSLQAVGDRGWFSTNGFATQQRVVCIKFIQFSATGISLIHCSVWAEILDVYSI